MLLIIMPIAFTKALALIKEIQQATNKAKGVNPLFHPALFRAERDYCKDYKPGKVINPQVFWSCTSEHPWEFHGVAGKRFRSYPYLLELKLHNFLPGTIEHDKVEMESIVDPSALVVVDSVAKQTTSVDIEKEYKKVTVHYTHVCLSVHPKPKLNVVDNLDIPPAVMELFEEKISLDDRNLTSKEAKRGSLFQTGNLCFCTRAQKAEKALESSFTMPEKVGKLKIVNEILQETVRELAKHGVTEDLIIAHWRPSQKDEKWGALEKKVLTYLIKNIRTYLDETHFEGLSATEALEEISQLTFLQLELLMDYYLDYGLRGSHFRKWNNENKSNPFTLDHEIAFRRFISPNLQVSVELGLSLISGIDNKTARLLEEFAQQLCSQGLSELQIKQKVDQFKNALLCRPSPDPIEHPRPMLEESKQLSSPKQAVDPKDLPKFFTTAMNDLSSSQGENENFMEGFIVIIADCAKETIWLTQPRTGSLWANPVPQEIIEINNILKKTDLKNKDKLSELKAVAQKHVNQSGESRETHIRQESLLYHFCKGIIEEDLSKTQQQIFSQSTHVIL